MSNANAEALRIYLIIWLEQDELLGLNISFLVSLVCYHPLYIEPNSVVSNSGCAYI